MSHQSQFNPQRQFHILINDANEEHNITMMPGQEGNFKVIKQGEVLGEVAYTPQKKVIAYKGRFKKRFMQQLEEHISHYYSYAF
ncbi:hypothetical protein ACFS5N_00980 [Mucilaginibacter ximonensis]|uniref:Uncharacterized protein n=1 Tax=Mucilaginibacter ximonensis TaxID=538021 RepID=A0ABW5Y6Q4_9SPHI